MLFYLAELFIKKLSDIKSLLSIKPMHELLFTHFNDILAESFVMYMENEEETELKSRFSLLKCTFHHDTFHI